MSVSVEFRVFLTFDDSQFCSGRSNCRKILLPEVRKKTNGGLLSKSNALVRVS